MASILRPTMLRQAYKHVPAKRAFVFIAPISQTAKTPPLTSSILRYTSLYKSTVSNRIPTYMSIASFHTSPLRPILPALPQHIEGTANDPAPVPEPSPTHGSYHWTFERLMSASLIPLTIAPFAAGSLNPVLDATLCFAILIHSHIGFQSVIIDYIPTWRLPKTRKALWWALRGATLFVGVGLYEFETNDVGLTEAIKKIWTA